MDPAFAKASLADLTRSCFEGARQSIQRLEGKDKIYMQTRLADLRLWADSVGATAQAKASLDQRFQHRPADLYFIRGLLFMLQGFFSECSIAADNKSDTTDIISNINSTIDSLAILGVQIRRSGRKSRLEKADGSFDGNREKYRTFRAHLACIIVSRPTENGRPGNEGREIHSVDYFANLELTSIQERLIEANLRRRHRFLEAQRHSRGLEDTDGLENAHSLKDISITPQQTITETPSGHARQGANSTPAGNVAATMQALLSSPRHGAPLTTVTSASGLDSKWGGLRDSRRPSSTTTRITTITAAARYPKAHAPSEQKLVKCPCCCQAIPASEAEASQWKKHLANDINPYTCILEDCPKPYNLFATHNEWKDHFMNDHPSQWYCPCCASNAPVFKSLSGVINHIMSRHPDAISDNLEDLLSDAEIKVMGITKCPLCDSEGPPDSPELVEHVLQHVHDFSLRSFPWPTDLPFSPSNPVATFNTDYATWPHNDDSGNKYSFSVAEWAESVAPKKGASGEISVVDSEGNELPLDMTKYPENTTPSDGPWLQLCNLDRNPPNISEVESPSVAQFNQDYFSGNPYFKDDSSDNWSSSQSRQSSRRTQNTSVMKKWACTLCDSQSGQGDDEYFRHLEDMHFEEIILVGNGGGIDIEEWKTSMLIGAYENGMDKISIADSPPISRRSTPPPRAIRLGYKRSEEIHRQEPEPRKKVIGEEFFDTLSNVSSETQDDWSVTFNEDVPRVLDVDLIHTLSCSSIIYSVRFSHDGKYLAAGCSDSVQIYDVSNGEKVWVLWDENMNHTNMTLTRIIYFSPDGKYLVTGAEDRPLQVWDIANRTIHHTFEEHKNRIISLDFARDARTMVSIGFDSTVRLWDIESSTNILTLTLGTLADTVAISPDAKYLAVGTSNGDVDVWDIQGRPLLRMNNDGGFQNHVCSIAFSPSGNELVGGNRDNTINMWDLPTSPPSLLSNTAPKEGRRIRTFKGHQDIALSITFTPDGSWVISGSRDGSVRFWDPHTSYNQLILRGHTGVVTSVAPSPTGGFFATGSGDERVRIWSYRSIAQ